MEQQHHRAVRSFFCLKALLLEGNTKPLSSVFETPALKIGIFVGEA